MICVYYVCCQDHGFIRGIVTKVKEFLKINMSWWDSAVTVKDSKKPQTAEFSIKNSSLKMPIPEI